MERNDWSRLNHLQVGRYAEYLVKMECTLYGLVVYTPEVDDKGIDFVIRAGADRFYDVQVKSLRSSGYVFVRKDRFDLRPTNLLALVLLRQGQAPDLYLIKSTVWRSPQGPFVSRDYPGLKSPPEWGINVSGRWMEALEPHRFERVVGGL